MRINYAVRGAVGFGEGDRAIRVHRVWPVLMSGADFGFGSSGSPQRQPGGGGFQFGEKFFKIFASER